MKILGLVLVLAVAVVASFFIAKKRKPSEIDVEIDHPSELETPVEVEQVVEQPKLEVKKKAPVVKKEKVAEAVTPVANPKSEPQPSQKAKKVTKK